MNIGRPDPKRSVSSSAAVPPSSAEIKPGSPLAGAKPATPDSATKPAMASDRVVSGAKPPTKGGEASRLAKSRPRDLQRGAPAAKTSAASSTLSSMAPSGGNAQNRDQFRAMRSNMLSRVGQSYKSGLSPAESDAWKQKVFDGVTSAPQRGLTSTLATSIEELKDRPIDKLTGFASLPTSFVSMGAQRELEGLEQRLEQSLEARGGPVKESTSSSVKKLGPSYEQRRAGNLGGVVGGNLDMKVDTGETRSESRVRSSSAGLDAEGSTAVRLGPRAEIRTEQNVGDLLKGTNATNVQADVEAMADGGVKIGPASAQARGSVEGRIGPKIENRMTQELAGGLKHENVTSAGLEAGGKLGADVKAGLSGIKGQASAEGGAGAAMETRGRLSHDGIGNLDYDLRGGVDLKGRAAGDATLDAKGLRAKGDIGVGVDASIEGGVNLDTDIARIDARGRAGIDAKAQAAGDVTADLSGVRAHVEGEASVRAAVEGKVHADTIIGGLDAAAQAYAEAYARGKVDADVGLQGARIHAAGEIGAVAAIEGQAQIRSPGIDLGGERLDIRADIRGRAEVAAKAEGRIIADATIVPPRANVDIGGRAFAGAKAEAEAKVGLGEFVAVGVKGGVWAGAGAEGKVILGFDDGKLRLGLGGGAAVGYGAGVSGVVEVDVKKMASAVVGTAVDTVSKGVRYALNPLEMVKDAGNIVNDVADKATKPLKMVQSLGEAVGALTGLVGKMGGALQGAGQKGKGATAGASGVQAGAQKSAAKGVGAIVGNVLKMLKL